MPGCSQKVPVGGHMHGVPLPEQGGFFAHFLQKWMVPDRFDFVFKDIQVPASASPCCPGNFQASLPYRSPLI